MRTAALPRWGSVVDFIIDLLAGLLVDVVFWTTVVWMLLG